MSERVKSLLVVRAEGLLSLEQMERIQCLLKPIAKQMGMKPLVVDNGLDVGIHSDIRPLLEEHLVEQRQTNQLLSLLIDALGEAEGDPDAERKAYMDGTLVGYQPSTGVSDPPGDE